MGGRSGGGESSLIGEVESVDGRASSVEGGIEEGAVKCTLVEDCLWNFVLHSRIY